MNEPRQKATPGTASSTPGVLESLDRIETVTLVLTIVGAGLAFAFFGSARAFGVLVGGAVGVGNFRALRILVKTFFTPPAGGEELTKGRKGSLALLALAKFFVFYGGVYLLLTRTQLDRMGFLLGFSALVLGIAAQGLRGGAALPSAGEEHPSH